MPDPTSDGASPADDARREPEAPAAGGPHSLTCMEVWGGNELMDSAIAVPGLAIHVYSRPWRGEVAGGDVLYVSSCGSGRIARLLVADVAGHGEHVAGLARTLRDLMRRYINYVDQTDFVSALNRAFGAAAATTGRFATAIVATYWAETELLTATNAGHPRPIWYSARTGTWTVLAARDGTDDRAGAANLPLGVIVLADYDQVMVRLVPGDILLFYTDSITEARGAGGAMLGEQGLVSLLGELDADRPEALVKEIVDAVERFRDGAEAEDDVTVVAMVCSGEKPRRSVVEKTGAMLRFGRALGNRLLGRPTPVPWPEMSLVNVLGFFIRPINQRWGGGVRPGEIRTGAAARRPDRGPG